MPAYTNSTNVNKHLPSGLPAAVTGQVATDIADASAMVDALVGSRYPMSYGSSDQRFPEIDGTPATPEIIEQAARFLAVSYQFARTKEHRRDDKSTAEERYAERAEKLLKAIREGGLAVTIAGASLRTADIAVVEDEIYEDNNSEAFMTNDDIDSFLY